MLILAFFFDEKSVKLTKNALFFNFFSEILDCFKKK